MKVQKLWSIVKTTRLKPAKNKQLESLSLILKISLANSHTEPT